MQNTLKQIRILLRPSWLSGLLAGCLSVAVVIVTIIISSYQGSSLQQELFEARAGHSTASVLGFETVTDNLTRSQLVNNLPLILFWAMLGVIVYLFATSLWGVLVRTEELREKLEYVNAPKQHLARSAAISLCLRLLFLGVWIGYLELFLKILLPYALAAAHIAAIELLSLSGAGYVLLALSILFVAVQLHAVCLRLVWLRLRLFGGV